MKTQKIDSIIRECFVRHRSKKGTVCPHCENFWTGLIKFCPLCSCRTVVISIGG